MLTSNSWLNGPVLLKPVTRRAALRAAEEILRSGGFALVVLSGTDPQGQEAVRLTRAAREGGAAFVSLTNASALSSLRVSSSVDPNGYQWHRTPFGEPAVAHDVLVRVRARAMGWNAHTQFLVPILHHELRLSLEPGLATGAAFDADLAPALLTCAPRVVVGDDNRIWVDARGLHAAQLAVLLIDTVRAHGIVGVRA